MARQVVGARAETLETKNETTETTPEGGTPAAPNPPPAPDASEQSQDPPPSAPPAPAKPEMVVPHLRYQVKTTRKVVHGGVFVEIKAGKIVDNANYDIDALVALGLELVQLPSETK